MQRQVCWTEREADGVKREVRVTVLRDGVKWQFKRKGDERWDYDSPPTREEWDVLLERVDNRYTRRCASLGDRELVRRLHRAATAAGDRNPGGPS